MLLQSAVAYCFLAGTHAEKVSLSTLTARSRAFNQSLMHKCPRGFTGDDKTNFNIYIHIYKYINIYRYTYLYISTFLK